MNNTSILEGLRILLATSGIPFFVVSADNADTILFSKYPSIVIQNTDVVGGAGKHWIAWYVTNADIGELFDPFGLPLSRYKYVKPVVKNIVKENCTAVQQGHTYVCGEFCIYFAYHRAIGFSFENIMSRFRKSRWYNDYLVVKFVNSIAGFHRHSLYSNNCACIQKCNCRIGLLEYYQ